MPRLLFLPGAGGRASFWKPAGNRLPEAWEKHYLSWPGLGIQPADPNVAGLEDLVSLVLERLTEPSDLVAQSMGVLVALKATLAEPSRVRRLVLAGAASGVPVAALGGADWGPDYRHEFAETSHWITEAHEDLSDRLGEIAAPTLVLAGERDVISPPAVAERLAALLPEARVHIVHRGHHDFPEKHPAEVAAEIERHLG